MGLKGILSGGDRGPINGAIRAAGAILDLVI